METIRLGKTGMMVSKLGFGGIPIQRVSEDDAVAVVKRALALGITYIDTANGYTTSEERIGKAISGRREGLFLATKSGSRTREGIAHHLEKSLKRLAVESIDLFQFHNISGDDTLDSLLAADGPMTELEEAKRAGKIKHIGFSAHSLDIAIEAVKTDRFETVLFPFNFITCEAADELLPLARKHDVGFIAMKPLAGGMLENATLAFKYLFQFPDIIPIPGISEIHEIEDIIRLLSEPLGLTEAEEKEIQRLREELGTRFCRRCDYCLPCIADIPIQTVIQFPSFVKRQPEERLFSTGMVSNAMAKAANCTECGDCEERCPYNLPIREMMADYADLFQTMNREYEARVVSR